LVHVGFSSLQALSDFEAPLFQFSRYLAETAGLVRSGFSSCNHISFSWFVSSISCVNPLSRYMTTQTLLRQCFSPQGMVFVGQFNFQGLFSYEAQEVTKLDAKFMNRFMPTSQQSPFID
jgi:hypothetical protein